MPEQASPFATLLRDCRAGWTEGPWTTEPDRAQWKTRAGLPGLIVRNLSGVLCGYAGVPRGHPAYGKKWREPIIAGLDAHGGVNYTAKCNGPICHVPAAGEPKDVWWVGFDCGHAADLTPNLATFFAHVRGYAYRDLSYVKRQVESLARQLKALR